MKSGNNHASFVCSVTRPLNGSQAWGEIILIYISLFLLCKSNYFYAYYFAFKWEKQNGLYQGKVTFLPTSQYFDNRHRHQLTQRPGRKLYRAKYHQLRLHPQAGHCQMAYSSSLLYMAQRCVTSCKSDNRAAWINKYKVKDIHLNFGRNETKPSCLEESTGQGNTVLP